MFLSNSFKKSKIILTVFLMSLFILPNFVVAQEAGSEIYDEYGFQINQPEFLDVEVVEDDASNNSIDNPDFQIDAANIISGESASCFDYYVFGSIDINLTSDFNSYEGGDSVKITGPIVNNNSYPIVGLDVRARLVKDIPNADINRSEILVLDEFVVADNITLDAGASYEVSYPFLLPLNAPSGDYQIYFYAIEQDRFNMSGLSFTNDIVASRIEFNVLGNTADHVYLDQTQIVVGEQPHNVMAFITKHLSGKAIPVTIPLYNSGDSEKQMNVTYDLYSWDDASATNKIDSKIEQVTVPAKSEVQLKYSISKPDTSVYYLSISAEPSNQEQDTSVFKEKTISNIRLSVDGLSKTRLNFVGINQYPLQKDSEATLVTCFHNTNNIESTNNSKVLTVMYDMKGKELARTEFEGKTNPNIVGLIQKFKPKRNISEFVIKSTVYDEKGEIIDEVEKVYSCQDINPQACSSESKNVLLPIMFLFIILVGLSIIVFKKKMINLTRV